MVQLKVDPAKELAHLETIASQLDAAKDVNKEGKQASIQFARMGEKVSEWFKENQENIDLESTLIDTTVMVLERIASYLNPIAAVGWTKTDLDTAVEKVRAMLTLGLYDESEQDRVQGVITTLASFSTPGTRQPRGQGTPIEGRPELVTITPMPTEANPVPQAITKQAGNRATSVGNLKSALIGWLTKAGVEVTDRQKDAIGEAVKSVVIDGKSQVLVGDFASIEIV